MTVQYEEVIPSNGWKEVTLTDATSFLTQAQESDMWVRGTDGTNPADTVTGGIFVPKNDVLKIDDFSEWFKGETVTRISMRAVQSPAKAFCTYA